jgi:hypothetical protein
MDTLENIFHETFSYIFIPREPNDEVKVLEFSGLEKDFRVKLQEHFAQDSLLISEKKKLSKQFNQKVQNKLPQDYIDHAVETSQTYQIIPLTLPTQKNNYQAINLYIDSISRIKNLPSNARASRIAGTDIRGDAFISSTTDDEIVFKRVDFTLEDYKNFLQNPPSPSNRWNQAEALAEIQKKIASNETVSSLPEAPKIRQCDFCHSTKELKSCSRCKKVRFIFLLKHYLQ